MYIDDSLFFRTLKLGRGEGRGRKGEDEGKKRRGGEGRGPEGSEAEEMGGVVRRGEERERGGE